MYSNRMVAVWAHTDSGTIWWDTLRIANMPRVGARFAGKVFFFFITFLLSKDTQLAIKANV